MPIACRYALYLIPAPGSRLWRSGSALLGYDALTGEDLEQPGMAGVSPAELAHLTAAPRHYGLHMTIKAPFRLALGYTPADLTKAVEALLRDHAPFALGDLAVRVRGSDAGAGGFVCLEPAPVPAPLAALERDIVVRLDRFRAPLTPDEIARRQPDRLTTRQRELLASFGYPFVLDEFRPHVSLSGMMPDAERLARGIREIIAPALDAARGEVAVLALFAQPDPASRFRLVQLFDRAGTSMPR